MVENMTLDNLILRWDDLYWSVYKKDYDFAGMTIEQRLQMVRDKDWKYPNKMV